MVFARSYIRRARAQSTIHHIGDPAVAHQALIQNADDFANQPASIFPASVAVWRNGERNYNITTADHGPHWRALRCNLTAHILHPSRVASLAPLLHEAAQDLVADLSARASAGSSEVGVRVPTNTALFGLVTRLYRPLFAARRQSRSKVRGGMVHPYVDSLLDLRIADGDVRRALRDSEMVGLVFEFLGAGTGTIAACVEWTLAHLISQPEIQARLRREIDDETTHGAMLSSKSLRSMPYLNAVVMESLRMHPPVCFILRGAHGEGAKEFVGATTMPAGAVQSR
ncbi:hypothetical protein ACQ4PT_032247 [Festuca glaucescens]